MHKIYVYYAWLFGVGGVGYCLIELLWRGYTDPTMALAGGIAFCLLAVIQKVMKQFKFFYRCIVGGLTITAVELAFGTVFNLWLNKTIWDYSTLPLNYLGQICLLYTVLWCLLSAPMLIATELLRQKIMTKAPKQKQSSP